MRVGELGQVSGPGYSRGAHRFAEAEVEDLHCAVGADLDIGRLQVAMNDAGLVRGFECLGDLLRDRQRFVQRDCAPPEALREVLAFDQLHHEGMHVQALGSRLRQGWRFDDPVDLCDIRVIQSGKRLRLAGEARDAVNVMRESVRQNLDGHVTSELRVAGAINFAHPTAT